MVIPCKICVRRSEHAGLPVGARDRSFQVVADNDVGNGAQKPQASHMSLNPTAQCLIGHRFHIGIIGTAHRGRNNLDLCDLARTRIDHRHTLAGKAHIQPLSCLMMNPHRDILHPTPLLVTRTEIPVAVPLWIRLNPVKPDPLQGLALARQLLMDPVPGRLGAARDGS